MKKIITVMTILISSSIYANTCSNLTDCSEAISNKTQIQYISSSKLKGEGFEIDLDHENAEEIFSHLLSSFGYTRILISKNIFEIINKRDVRYRESPIIDANKHHVPIFRPGNDYYMMRYKLISKKVPIGAIARNLRPFMSRYGRIIDINHSATILVNDSAKNLLRLHELIRELDVELSDKEFKDYLQLRSKRAENKS
jgi:type II secretory pathway component GspD/PulD (secretin)